MAGEVFQPHTRGRLEQLHILPTAASPRTAPTVPAVPGASVVSPLRVQPFSASHMIPAEQGTR